MNQLRDARIENFNFKIRILAPLPVELWSEKPRVGLLNTGFSHMAYTRLSPPDTSRADGLSSRPITPPEQAVSVVTEKGCVLWQTHLKGGWGLDSGWLDWTMHIQLFLLDKHLLPKGGVHKGCEKGKMYFFSTFFLLEMWILNAYSLTKKKSYYYVSNTYGMHNMCQTL